MTKRDAALYSIKGLRMTQSHHQPRTTSALTRLLFILGTCAILAIVLSIAHTGVQGPYFLDSAKLTPITDHVHGKQVDVLETESMSPRLLGRIVSIATFVAEAQITGENLDPTVSKTVNIGIHIVSGLGVLALLYYLTSTTTNQRTALLLASAAVSLWLLSPTNMGTAFYAVQRIAQLSSLFIITGLLAYTALRIGHHRPTTNIALLTSYAISLLLAIGSKENGVNLILLTVAIEYFFFGFRNRYVHQRQLLIATCGTLGICAILVLLLKPGYLDYSLRPFTLVERLLTQARIIPMYIGDLLLPHEHSTGLYKKVLPSTGLFTPISTFFGLIAMLLYVCALLVLHHFKQYLIAFGLAFFLIGHGIESSIIPLELHFRHRNYLPSIGLYFALVATVYQIATQTNRPRLAVALFSVYLTFMAATSYARATAWASDIEMGASAYRYNPNSYRAATNYARLLIEAGRIEQAFELLDQAIRNNPRNDFVYRMQHLFYACIFHRDIPDDVYHGIASAKNEIPDIEISSILQMVTRSAFEKHECPTGSVSRLVSALGKFAEQDHTAEINPWYVHYYRVRLLRTMHGDEAANTLLEQLLEDGYANAGLMLADHFLRNNEEQRAEKILSQIEEEFGSDRIDGFSVFEDDMQRRHGIVLERK